MKPPSTARTAGRSDWAERRFRRQPFILLSFSSSKKARKEQETQSYQRFHASVIRTSRVSQTPPQTPPPYFYQWVSHGKKWSWHNRLQNAPRLFSLVKVSTPSALRERFHTAAHTAKQGPPLPRPHAWLSAAIEIALNAAFAILDSATLLYTYISRFPVPPHYQQMRKIRRNCHRNSVPNRSSLCFSTSRTNGPRLLPQAKVSTHSAL